VTRLHPVGVGVAIFALVVSLSGCLSGPASRSVSGLSPEQARELTGRWQGWLVTEQSFAAFDLEIAPDGTFEVTGQRTSARGVVVATDGALRFDGTGLWRGVLRLARHGAERSLWLERDDRAVRGWLHPIERDS